MLYRFCSKFHTAFQQCKNVENRLRFDKVNGEFKVENFFLETQCIVLIESDT